MSSQLIISLVAMLASLLTFFSGFGLGTILIPAFGLYYPIEQSIILTSIVHLSNNVFKVGLVWKDINWLVLLKFSLFSIPCSIAGAYLLKELSSYSYLNAINYTLLGIPFSTTLIKVTIAIILIFFAINELYGFIEKNITINKNATFVGGALSGFFGGLSGSQGALRSAFLINLNLSKMEFISTGTAIAVVIDISRISYYFNSIESTNISSLEQSIMPVISAILGAIIGYYLIKKIELTWLKKLIGIALLLYSLALILGKV
jgi:hypothetical protein